MGDLRALGRTLFARPYLLLTLTTLIWGGNAVAGRMAVGELSPMVLVSLRWVIVVAVLAVTARGQILAEWPLLRRHWPRIVVMATFGFTVFNALFYVAAQTTTAINIGMIQGIMPALVIWGSYLAYRTPITLTQVLGVAVALAGVVVTAARGDLDVLRHLSFVVGDIWMGLACLLYAGYSVSLRRRPPASPLALFAALAIAALASSLPLLAYEIAAGRHLWPSPKGWAVLLFVAIFPSLVSQIFYMRGIELIGPGRAGLFINLVPIFAAILAVLLLGETFAPYHAVALALVLAGIALAETGRPAQAVTSTPSGDADAR